MSPALMRPRFRLLDDFRKEIDELMTRFLDGSDEPDFAQWMPRMNLAETDDQYDVTVDLPGLKPEDFSVELRHGDLWITGNRSEEEQESGRTWHRVERPFGQFRRVIRLGDDVDSEKVNAEYKDGVLRITIAKTEDSRTRKIEVKG